jgi:hypothetical protein
MPEKAAQFQVLENLPFGDFTIHLPRLAVNANAQGLS